jgi:hypothetical protein
MPSNARTRQKGASKYEPTAQDRQTVALMTAAGIAQDEICGVLSITAPTLRRHYRHEIDTALASANARISGRLFAKADKGDVACMIFWLKARAKWSERIIVQDGGQADDFNPRALSDADLDARIARLTAKPARATH